MAHPAQQEFCREVKQKYGDFFLNTRVLEIGSRDVNGSVREEFDNCTYTGIDAESGNGVDQACLGHEFEAPPESFDVVCSLETFEHDPHAPQTVANMLKLLRPGGLFFMTCAGEGRKEHGTRRTGPLYGPDENYYQNVSLAMFLDWVKATSFEELYLRHNKAVSDLYCFAIKAQ
ncbi:class I SAM-dependent methyltransferase [uncultured Gimesia sp.]|uniref:class I SAM-dependent methyltransferase n=1 Tax=uncultured Gimesia sp. TaxID=1678688 RepID=UPI00260E5BAF|nr:class I SAM-dependent methyltransferase [uncultured Gimesia sp.]